MVRGEGGKILEGDCKNTLRTGVSPCCTGPCRWLRETTPAGPGARAPPWRQREPQGFDSDSHDGHPVILKYEEELEGYTLEAEKDIRLVRHAGRARKSEPRQRCVWTRWDAL